ncbi:hypothetical protein HDV57DRAFT_293406 [Trichoderma longibrachiatum]
MIVSRVLSLISISLYMILPSASQRLLYTFPSQLIPHLHRSIIIIKSGTSSSKATQANRNIHHLKPKPPNPTNTAPTRYPQPQPIPSPSAPALPQR